MCFIRLTPWAHIDKTQADIGSRVAGNRKWLCSLQDRIYHCGQLTV